jgi:hypothetical protein
VNDDWFVFSDWPQQTSAATGSAGTDKRDDNAPFSEALARLFNAAGEAGAPPRYLRELLAAERWRPIPLPAPAVCAAAFARTRAFAVSGDGRAVAGRKKKRALPLLAANADNSVAFQATADDAADTIDARVALEQLRETTSLVVLAFGDQYYGFNRAQCRALGTHFQSLADRRAASLREQRDRLLLTGAGTLDEFLAMTVRAHHALKPICTAYGDVMELQTLGYRCARHDSRELPLGEWVQQVATRQDFVGVQFNREYGDKAAYDFGPNFAAFCVRGLDPRHAGPCPARHVREIHFGVYLTRRFTRVDAHQKALISQTLAQSRDLLGAIDPTQMALPRSALISLDGAYAVRQFPQVVERRWLVDFIARAERALKARWRIGVF